MTVKAYPIALQQLSIATVFRDALTAVFGRPRTFTKIARLPFLLLVALILLFGSINRLDLPEWMSAGTFTPIMILLGLNVVSCIPFALLGISTSRAMLVGVDSAFEKRLGQRTWIWAGYALAIQATFYGFILLLSIAIAAARTTLSPFEGPPALAHWVIPGGLPFLLAFLYGAARLSLLFPAVAISESQGLSGAWRLTRGNGLKLMTIFGVFVLAAVLIAWLIPAILEIGAALVVWLYVDILPVEFHFWPGPPVSYLPAAILTSLLACCVVALLVAAATSALRQLSGRSGPREEILERFE